jgi:hypothetical protein
VRLREAPWAAFDPLAVRLPQHRWQEARQPTHRTVGGRGPHARCGGCRLPVAASKTVRVQHVMSSAMRGAIVRVMHSSMQTHPGPRRDIGAAFRRPGPRRLRPPGHAGRCRVGGKATQRPGFLQARQCRHLAGARRRRRSGGSNAGPSPGPAPLQLGAALYRATRLRAASEPETAALASSSAQPRREHACADHLGCPGGWSPCPRPRRRPACLAAPTRPRSSGARTDPTARRRRGRVGYSLRGIQGLRSLRWRRRGCTSWRASLKPLRAGRAEGPRGVACAEHLETPRSDSDTGLELMEGLRRFGLDWPGQPPTP